MKRLLSILFLLCVLNCSAQLPLTHDIIGTRNGTSYDAPPYSSLLWGYYIAYLDCIDPSHVHMLGNTSRAGQGLNGDYQGGAGGGGDPLYCPTFWAFAASNGVVPFDFRIGNDDEGLNSNTTYSAILKINAEPGTMYNGTADTNEGLGGIPLAHYYFGAAVHFGSADGDGGEIGRNNACTNFMKLTLGLNPIDWWNDTWTNGANVNTTDLTGNNWGLAGSHLTPMYALASMISWVRATSLPTNVGSFTLDWNDTSKPVSTNSLCIVNISGNGNTRTFTMKADRMPFGGERLAGISNLVSSGLYTNAPALAGAITWNWSFTNLPAGNYRLLIDGIDCADFASTGSVVTLNMATNQVANNPFNAQQTQILYDLRNEDGVNPTNGTQTHAAGSVNPVDGQNDMINYQSFARSVWPGLHGPTIATNATLWSDVLAMWSRAQLRKTHAQQTNHTIVLTALSITIDSTTAVALPSSANYRSVGNAPSDASVQYHNPPLFHWTYSTNISTMINPTVFNFRLQLSTNNFAGTYWDIACSNNFYNFLPPITNAGGATWLGTNWWRVIYQNSNATVNVSTGAVHTFTLASTAVNWNRAMLADTNYLLGIATNHPHLWFTNGGIPAMATFLKSNVWQTVGKSWTSTTNDARIYQVTNWWNSSTITNLSGTSLLIVSLAVQDVAVAYYFNSSNAFWDVTGAAGTLDWFATAFRQQGLDMTTPYDVDPGTYQRMADGYDWLYPFMTTGQRSNVLDVLKSVTFFCAYNDRWGYAMVPAVTNRIYTNALTVNYSSGMKIASSHERFDAPVGLTCCLAGMGESPELLALFPMFQNYSIAIFDPYQGDEGRSYSEQDNFKYDREFAAVTLSAVTFPSAQLALNPILTNLGAFFMAWEPVGYRGVFDPWGDLGYGFQSQWFHTRYYDLACLVNDGSILRGYTRAQSFKPFAGESYPLLGEAFLPFYYPQPAETDATTTSYFDVGRGWAMSASGVPTAYDTFTNGVGMVFQARPAGARIEHSSFTDGQVDMWAYGASVTAGGAAQNYAKHPMYYNGLMVNGIGLMNPPIPADPFYGKLANWTNCLDFTLAYGNITAGYNRSNYNTTGLGNSTYPFYTYASNTVPYVSNISRTVLFPHKKYLVLFDQMQTTTNATFQWLWHIAQPTSVVNTNACSFTYTCTNQYNGSNVTVYVQHIVDPTTMGLTNVVGTNFAKLNPFTGENYMATDGDNGPWVASTIWITNRTATTNWHFMSAVFPAKWGDPAPTITRIDDYTVRVQQGAIDDVITFDPNYAGSFNYKVNLNGGPSVIYRPTRLRARAR